MELYRLASGTVTNTGTLVTEIVFAVCVVIILSARIETRKEFLWRAVDALAVLVCQTGIALLFHLALGLNYMGSPSLPALFAGLCVYALFQIRLSVEDRLVRCTTFAAYFIAVVSLTTVLLPAWAWLKSTSVAEVVPSAVSYIATIGFAFVLRRFSVEGFSFIPRGFVAMIVLTDALAALATYSFLIFTVPYTVATSIDSIVQAVPTAFEQSVLWVSVIVDVSFIALVAVAYLMFFILAREHDERALLLVSKRNDADTALAMKATQSMYDSLRLVRHELRNHDAYLSTLLKDGDVEAMREFFEKNSAASSGLLDYISCGNRAVDTVVNAKIALARARGVEVKTMLAVPAELPYATSDLFSLMSNVLDNAIEGTHVSPSPSGPVSIELLPRNGYDFIIVSNPCDASRVRRNELGDLVTSKKDDEVHGFGTRVIRSIAEKYDGSAGFDVRDGVFTATIMLRRAARKG